MDGGAGAQDPGGNFGGLWGFKESHGGEFPTPHCNGWGGRVFYLLPQSSWDPGGGGFWGSLVLAGVQSGAEAETPVAAQALLPGVHRWSRYEGLAVLLL